MFHGILLCFAGMVTKVKRGSKPKLQGTDPLVAIYAYRYLSWALTSFVYLTGKPYSILFLKLGVIVSLFIFTIVITDLNVKFKDNTGILKILVLIETVGITLLLLPTGGLVSPFIWYALNPTLVAASYLPAYFCWINLTFYLIAGSAVSYYLFNPNTINITTLLIDNTNQTLVFVLITLAVQLLANLTQKLYRQTKVLTLTNNQKQESIDYIMSLYQIIEALNNHSTKDKLFKTLADYTTMLTKSDLSLFWLPGTKSETDMIKASIKLSTTELEDILNVLKTINLQGSQLNEIKEITIGNKEYLTIPIIATASPSGLIAIQKRNVIPDDELEQNIKLLEFLAGLSAVTLDRFNLEDIEDNFLLMEEQNRIANEIHDSVSQRLFSISYAIHGILGRWQNMSMDDLKDYLIEMNESSNAAMQELRNSIYKLSSKKKGEKALQVNLKTFLDSISKLYHINIELAVEGDESLLPLSLKQGITRIIREACSNAIRHGGCQQIVLHIDISRKRIQLSIADDGNGFILMKQEKHIQKGLGIANMKGLVYSFNGTIEIKSELGNGTIIIVIIPVKEGLSIIQQEEVAI